MTPTYHRGSRRLQDRFDTRRLADRLDERFVRRAVIDDDDRAFIERMDMFFLATADAEGRPQCSYKGGDPGFVRVLDEHTIAFPNYDGNGMYLSMGNLLGQPARRPAVHRLHRAAAVAAAAQRRRERRRATTRCGRLPGRAVRRAGARRRRSSRTARATSTGWQLVERSRFVPHARPRAAGARVEAHRLGVRRAACRRSRSTGELT